MSHKVSHCISSLLLALVISFSGFRPALTLQPPSLPQAEDGSLFAWTFTGSMNHGRFFPMVASLADGRVLAAGGYNDYENALISAEVYDPTTGIWTPTGNMNSARYQSTITVLTDGRMLAAGGYDGSNPVMSAEVYDPTGNDWTSTGSMSGARYGHIATELLDGRVLVAGGYIENEVAINSAEVYDPTTGIWTPTGNMNNARYQPAASLLSDGRVLVTGGRNHYDNVLNSAEVYDPVTGIWSLAGSMSVSRYFHAATLLPDGHILVSGGRNDNSLVNADMYDPATGTWAPTGSLNIARAYHTATLLPDGQVLVAGGYDGGSSLASAELYDPATATWNQTSPMNTPRRGHGMALLSDGRILVAGGYYESYLTSAELYSAITPILFAKPDGLTGGSCDSWDNACDLQYALTSAAAGQEIWATAGVYKPTNDPTDRTSTFQLRNGVALYGGFSGTETSRDQRDWKTNKSVISGDIDNNDINNDGNFIAETTADIQGANVYHVVSSSFLDASAILDGFFITAGQASDSNVIDSYRGGGLYNYLSSPTLQNITFSGNLAQNGGGMYNQQASPSLTNISFTANSASTVGGGLFNNLGSPILKDIVFSENSANLGGGLWNENGSPSLSRISFISNSAAESGGGMGGYWSSPSLDNVVFYANSANNNGGGMYNWYYSNPSLSNVTFHANSANQGGGISNDYSSPVLINSILWGNSAPEGPQIYNYNSPTSITYSTVQGGWPSTGNIEADPLFVDPGNGDLHLQTGSPAIDTGTNSNCPTTDLEGISRPQDGNYDGFFTCDMGAYEVVGGPAIPPANDNFAYASVIDTLPFNGVVNNVFASLETGEPQSCSAVTRTVWYKFTPNENMQLKVDVIGSDFADPFFSVYQAAGTGFGDLSLLHCSAYDTPEVFNAEAGVTYYIQAGSINSLGGALHLNVQELIPPPNDNFADAETITTLPFDTIVDISGATTEQVEPSYCTYSPQTVWYKFTPAVDATVQVNVVGSNFNTVLTFYQATDHGFAGLSKVNCIVDGRSQNFSVQAGLTYYIQAGSTYTASGELHLSLEEISPPANDNFENPTVIPSSLPYDDTVDMTNASLQAGEPVPSSCAWYGSLWKTVWYAYTPETSGIISASVPDAPFAPVLTAYTGISMTNLTELGCQTYWGNELNLAVEAGTTYYFQVGKLTWWDMDGSMHFHLVAKNPPSNDNFAKAREIDVLPYSDEVDITNATLEAGEPTGCYYPLSRTIWYSFMPSSDMLVQVSTYGSGNFLDSFYNVYKATGSGLDGLVNVHCAAYGEPSRFMVQAGVTYYIQAGSLTDSGGILNLQMQELPRPANDDFANATIISEPLPFEGTANNQYATWEAGEPISRCTYSVDSEHSIWYAFTPSTNVSLTANIPWAKASPLLAVYTGSSLSDLTEIACRSSSDNPLTFHADAGTTYYFQISLYSGIGGGEMDFRLEVTPPPVAAFDYSPYDPTTFDTIQFSDASYDPGQVNIETLAWDFGDRTTSTEASPVHQYARDGDYTVHHSVTTHDGRTASITQVVHVKTRDVAITKLAAPQSASTGQTRTVTVFLNSKAYSETVQVDLYRSGAGGFELIGTLTQTVPAYNANRTVAYNFSYTFTSADASIGKVTFYAVATIIDGRDIYPADNEAYSLPTRVNKRR